MARLSLLLVFAVFVSVFSICVSAQPSGEGGGKCYEAPGTVYECPRYNYTRHGTDHNYYQFRRYHLDTWAIVSVTAAEIISNHSQPIEGMVAVYPPLDAYFHGANSAGMNITRNVAPVAVAWFDAGAGAFYYSGVFFLPTLPSYPPPLPTNTTAVAVVGGPRATLELFSHEFSLDHVPTDEEIEMAAIRFARQLTSDGHHFQPIPIVAWYDAIDAKGNWTKEIWFEPANQTLFTHFDTIQSPTPYKSHRQ